VEKLRRWLATQVRLKELKEIEEGVDRRVKKGKPGGRDKGAQASTPPVTVSPAGT